ncbi:E2 protein [Mesocricetus auratus papillomavirus 1]|uniref:Regulatory protein E2 n=1 Tax=Mesocricetus auratus papillomavirus 1 TaxID=1408129 RepID=U6EJK2_9PAPI|nr:E2 protein [Mesocricetus auratus papillomavirus 1]CDI44928.1 E2 protein [Mesocricetus auratus papillomavirus 1]
MPTLTERFDAVQDQILNLIEKGSTALADHVLYWDLVRKEGVLQYYARKHNMNRLGLHALPCQLGAETKAKKAIQMGMLLRSLLDSKYGSEPWTVSETSLELYEQTDPEKTFKKGGQTIEVHYDNDPENSVAYTLWKYLYKQDEAGQWHKLEGGVDYAGLYYVEVNGMHVYYEEFCEDSDRYGQSSTWTVKYNNTDICAPVTSSTREEGTQQQARKRQRTDASEDSLSTWTASSPEEDSTSDITTPPSSPRRGYGPSHSSPTRFRRGGRRGEQGEPTPSPTFDAISPIPARHPAEGPRGVSEELPRAGFGGYPEVLGRSGDPPILLLTGPANCLKCWRNRVKRRPHRLYKRMSTCFSWVSETGAGTEDQRLLIAFTDALQREQFLRTVPLPRGSLFYRGFLEGL